MDTFNQMLDSLHSPIVFESVYDADLSEIGEYFTDSDSESQLIEAAQNALNAAKPFPLTGIIKTDAKTLVNTLIDSFKKQGIELGTAVVNSPNFGNEIYIPIQGKPDLYLETMIDYNELAYNGSDFVLQLNLSSDELGCIEFVDLDNYNNIQILINKIKE